MKIIVGSIESSDLMIEINDKRTSVEIQNLAFGLDEMHVKQYLIEKLNEQDLLKFNPIIHFNGANEWVIESRLEHIHDLLKRNQK